jgi:hypothetical protein
MKNLYIFVFSPLCNTSCLSHSPWFAHMNSIWWGYKSWSSSLFSFLHHTVTSSPLVPNILRSTYLLLTYTLRFVVLLLHVVSFMLFFCLWSYKINSNYIIWWYW